MHSRDNGVWLVLQESASLGKKIRKNCTSHGVSGWYPDRILVKERYHDRRIVLLTPRERAFGKKARQSGMLVPTGYFEQLAGLSRGHVLGTAVSSLRVTDYCTTFVT
ncbi:hypothetical protein ACOMHN_051251 [Nucella lapillus]